MIESERHCKEQQIYKEIFSSLATDAQVHPVPAVQAEPRRDPHRGDGDPHLGKPEAGGQGGGNQALPGTTDRDTIVDQTVEPFSEKKEQPFDQSLEGQ